MLLFFKHYCSIDLLYENLQITIILFTLNVSSYKTNWILSDLPLLAPSCLLYLRVSSLMNALEEECLCLHQISINVNKLFIIICVFGYVILAKLLWHVHFLFYLSIIISISVKIFHFENESNVPSFNIKNDKYKL